MLAQTQRNIHRAIIGLGPYRLAPSFAHRQITPVSWNQLSEREKTTRLKWLDTKYKSLKPLATTTVSKMSQLATEVKPAVSSTETATNETIDLRDIDSDVNQTAPQSATNNSFLGDFETSNLPEFFKGSWSNANKIIASEGVGKAPGVANARVVVSNTSAGFHHVSLDSKGCPVKCDCP